MDWNNHRMLQGGINWEFSEQLSIKTLEMAGARKQTRPEVGQEGNKFLIFNSELGIRMTKLKNN